MKKFLLLGLLFSALTTVAADSTFWGAARGFELGEKRTFEHEWGRENVTYLGTMEWKTPSGKTVELRILTCYRQITQANGFKDESILALVKTNHRLIKQYDMVKRQNLPLEIRDNQLYLKPDGEDGREVLASLPVKFSQRFCITGMTCYEQIHFFRYYTYE